tara:strand:- start:505 stop:1017 length:513 start_codon:yes stop_codon:yes gene_type:complete
MSKKNIYGLMLSTALLVTVSSGAIAATTAENDQLFLKNGDRLSGQIIGYTPATVSITTAYGDFTVPVEKIGGVASPRYNLDDFAATQPAVNQDTAPVTAAIDSPQTPSAPTPSEPIAQTPPEEDETGLWGAEWEGDVNLGGKIQSGNSDSKNINIDAETKARPIGMTFTA